MPPSLPMMDCSPLLAPEDGAGAAEGAGAATVLTTVTGCTTEAAGAFGAAAAGALEDDAGAAGPATPLGEVETTPPEPAAIEILGAAGTEAEGAGTLTGAEDAEAGLAGAEDAADTAAAGA